MISYFKRLLLSRLLVLIILFLAIRIPLLLLGVPVTLPELKAMVLGERLSEGFVLYRDVYDTMAPLSAVLFWLLDVIFGRNVLVYRTLATLLLFLQAMRLNNTFNRHGVLPEKSFLPALLYLVFGSIFFELDTLSPLLLGITFLIFSLSYLIAAPKEGSSNPQLFKAGFLLGLAALCHLPLILFAGFAFFAIILFAFNAFRSTLLLICGFLFPYSVLYTFLLYAGALPNFVQYNLLSSWEFEVILILPALDLLKLLLVPVAFLGFCIFFAVSRTPGLNYQLKFLQLMLVWLPLALLTAVASQSISTTSWLLLLPALAYFGSFFFLRSRNWWLTEPLFLVLLGLILLLRYYAVFPETRYTRIDISRLAVQTGPQYEQIKNKRVLVLGDDFSYYALNKAATPYVNWQLALEDFGQLDSYYAVFRVVRNVSASRPQYIIDQAGLMPELRYKAPREFRRYQRLGQTLVYERAN